MRSLRDMSQREAFNDQASVHMNVNAPVLVQCPAGSEHCGALLLLDLMIGEIYS